MERKEHLLHKLEELLLETYLYEDLNALTYVQERPLEYCLIRFNNGYTKRVNITADGDLALIKDVLKALY